MGDCSSSYRISKVISRKTLGVISYAAVTRTRMRKRTCIWCVIRPKGARDALISFQQIRDLRAHGSPNSGRDFDNYSFLGACNRTRLAGMRVMRTLNRWSKSGARCQVVFSAFNPFFPLAVRNNTVVNYLRWQETKGHEAKLGASLNNSVFVNWLWYWGFHCLMAVRCVSQEISEVLTFMLIGNFIESNFLSSETCC